MYRSKFVLLTIFLWAIVARSQTANDYLKNGLEANNIAEKLPPLDSLIAMAKKNNPFLKSFDSTKELGEGKVQLEKRSWLQYLSLDAGYGYGIFDNLSDQQIAGDPGNQILFSTEQSRFNLGASLKMPVSALINRNRTIKNTKLEAETFKYEQQQAENELRLKVINEYNEVLKFHRLVFINNSIVETFRAQTIRAEKEFADGIINVADYTRLLQMINQAIMALEAQKSDFFKAFMALESTVGVNLTI